MVALLAPGLTPTFIIITIIITMMMIIIIITIITNINRSKSDVVAKGDGTYVERPKKIVKREDRSAASADNHVFN